MPSAVPLHIVDAFADRPFRGNPAAVCLLAAPADTAWMQVVAAEMNLSETAFVSPEGERYRLRWFTPAIEVRLCGHATLATAHTLWATGRLPAQARAEFLTLSGLLTVERDGSLLQMDFPTDSPVPADAPAGLAEALGLPGPLHIARGREDLLVRLESAKQVAELSPDFRRLGRLEGIRGVIVTAAADNDTTDFVSRFFGPAVGVDEDPVTGSAHCLLGPYWAAELGRDELHAYQASARGGTLRLRLRGERILIGGQAVTVAEGTLNA